LGFLVSEFFSLFLMSANSSVAGNDERDQHLPAKILVDMLMGLIFTGHFLSGWPAMTTFEFFSSPRNSFSPSDFPFLLFKQGKQKFGK
jgi:hypothetical protein